jgi:TrpR-related protein YerC/YecD
MRKYHWKDQETRELFQAVLALKNNDEAERFFRDLCTLEEIDEMARRWQAAQRLAKEEAYRDVADDVGLSTSTVARVAHWLHSGMGGYQLILCRLGLLK